MVMTPRRRSKGQPTTETTEESGAEEASAMFLERYPDLNPEAGAPDDDAPLDALAQKAREVFRKKMKEGN
jgi:hypothetical protein